MVLRVLIVGMLQISWYSLPLRNKNNLTKFLVGIYKCKTDETIMIYDQHFDTISKKNMAYNTLFVFRGS